MTTSLDISLWGIIFIWQRNAFTFTYSLLNCTGQTTLSASGTVDDERLNIVLQTGTLIGALLHCGNITNYIGSIEVPAVSLVACTSKETEGRRLCRRLWPSQRGRRLIKINTTRLPSLQTCDALSVQVLVTAFAQDTSSPARKYLH